MTTKQPCMNWQAALWSVEIMTCLFIFPSPLLAFLSFTVCKNHHCFFLHIFIQLFSPGPKLVLTKRDLLTQHNNRKTGYRPIAKLVLCPQSPSGLRLSLSVQVTRDVIVLFSWQNRHPLVCLLCFLSNKTCTDPDLETSRESGQVNEAYAMVEPVFELMSKLKRKKIIWNQISSTHVVIKNRSHGLLDQLSRFWFFLLFCHNIVNVAV